MWKPLSGSQEISDHTRQNETHQNSCNWDPNQSKTHQTKPTKQTKSWNEKKMSTLSNRHPSTVLVDLYVAEFILYKLQLEKGCVKDSFSFYWAWKELIGHTWEHCTELVSAQHQSFQMAGTEGDKSLNEKPTHFIQIPVSNRKYKIRPTSFWNQMAFNRNTAHKNL